MSHAWAAASLAAYGAGVVAAVAAAALRPGATLWRGGGVVVFSTLFLAPGLVAMASGRPPALTLAFGALILAWWVLRSRWLVIGAKADALGGALAECAGKVRAPCEPAAGGYRVRIADGALEVRIRPLGARLTLVTFDPCPHRKARLLRQLLAKQFAGALPTVRVRTG